MFNETVNNHTYIIMIRNIIWGSKIDNKLNNQKYSHNLTTETRGRHQCHMTLNWL